MKRIKSPQLYQLSYRPDSASFGSFRALGLSPKSGRCARGVPPRSLGSFYHGFREDDGSSASFDAADNFARRLERGS